VKFGGENERLCDDREASVAEYKFPNAEVLKRKYSIKSYRLFKYHPLPDNQEPEEEGA